MGSDSLTLFWKAPEDDGNDNIIEYIIEYHEETKVDWTRITEITDTSYKIDKLKQDTNYLFRVIAVNSVGAGPPSPTSDYIRVTAPFDKEPPIIVEPLGDRYVSLKEKVVLSTIVGGAPAPTITWYKNKETITTEEFITYENRVAKYTIEETTETTEGEYSCIAVNELGKAATSCKLIVQDKPSIDIEEKYLTQKLRKNTNYKITANVSGFPRPEITLYRDNVKIEIDEVTTITYENYTLNIEISQIDRTHTGKYTIEAKNQAGVARKDLILTVIGMIFKISKIIKLNLICNSMEFVYFFARTR